MLREGIAQNVPVDTASAGVEFGTDLVPSTPLNLPSVPPGRFPNEGQDHQRYYLWLPEGAGGVDLQASVKRVWANRMPN